MRLEQRESQRLQALAGDLGLQSWCKPPVRRVVMIEVLSVTILETIKTIILRTSKRIEFYRSQFWRLQKPKEKVTGAEIGFIGHNFGDYKNSNGIS